MTDRELLERAAKAAGMKPGHAHGEYAWHPALECLSTMDDRHREQPWNPLDDDGDCARLEAELGLCTIWCPTMVRSETIDLSHAWTESYADHSGDKQAARRRASVRAAATISNTTSAPDTTTAGAKG